MHSRPRPFAFLLVAAAFATPAAHAAVIVTHGDPDRFTDAGDRSNDPVKVMQAIETHLRKLGDRILAPGTNLRIEVLDVDLAGRPRMNMPTEIRVMNGKTDRPCIELRYSLEKDGARSAPQHERVCDSDYLRPGARDSANDPLVYEKRMLEEWFRARFARRP